MSIQFLQLRRAYQRSCDYGKIAFIRTKFGGGIGPHQLTKA